jgi:hypothetical protein
MVLGFRFSYPTRPWAMFWKQGKLTNTLLKGPTVQKRKAGEK